MGKPKRRSGETKQTAKARIEAARLSWATHGEALARLERQALNAPETLELDATGDNVPYAGD